MIAVDSYISEPTDEERKVINQMVRHTTLHAVSYWGVDNATLKQYPNGLFVRTLMDKRSVAEHAWVKCAAWKIEIMPHLTLTQWQKPYHDHESAFMLTADTWCYEFEVFMGEFARYPTLTIYGQRADFERDVVALKMIYA